MPDQLGEVLREQGKSDIHPLMAASLGKLLYSCFLYDLHHPTDDPVKDGATYSSVWVVGCGVFSPARMRKIIPALYPLCAAKDYYRPRMYLEIQCASLQNG